MEVNIKVDIVELGVALASITFVLTHLVLQSIFIFIPYSEE